MLPEYLGNAVKRLVAWKAMTTGWIQGFNPVYWANLVKVSVEYGLWNRKISLGGWHGGRRETNWRLSIIDSDHILRTRHYVGKIGWRHVTNPVLNLPTILNLFYILAISLRNFKGACRNHYTRAVFVSTNSDTSCGSFQRKLLNPPAKKIRGHINPGIQVYLFVRTQMDDLVAFVLINKC